MTTIDLRTGNGRYEPIRKRCGKCGKKMLADIGPNIYGDDGTHEFCPSCSPLTPESSWAAVDEGWWS